jgi:hypothetical protein
VFQITPFESENTIMFLMAYGGINLLDAVGTAGGSGTAFIVITDDDIVTVLSLVL